MRTVDYKTWKEFNTIEAEFDETIVNSVKEILKNVKENKDSAVIKYTEKFDGVLVNDLKVSKDEIEEAWNNVNPLLIEDLKIAYQNILTFHEKQVREGYQFEVTSNSYVGQKITPIEQVGIYVPGGTASYPSTVLMNTAPAKIAGVKRIVMISPPNKQGKISDIILVAAKIAGVDEIYKVGGAQGVAALAYGIKQISPVNKIVGPGNIYVALAKKEVFGVVGIDMIAGPSEIVVYADQDSNPIYVASDLLSQAEHDVLARAILVTDSNTLIEKVNIELTRQMNQLSRTSIMRQSLNDYGYAIKVSSKEEAIEVINDIAPEHLELLTKDCLEIEKKITNAGAIFLGEYSPEPLGDYMAGPNHTLPTSKTATFSSALSVDDFVKKTSIINFSKEGLKKYSDSIMRIAKEEGLTAHRNAIKVRFEDEN